MSKYIIELPDNVKKIVYFHVGNANAIWTTANDLDDLEELNSDYINENFGELQEEAYQRGHDDGYEAGCATAFKPVSDAEYQRGFEDGKNSINNGCEGCKCEGQKEYEEPCMSCSNAFPNKYEPMPKQDDSIKVGDEEPCLINEQTRQALNSAISVLSETMDRIKEKLEIFNG